MSELPGGESDPLVDRVDLLLKRHRQLLRTPDDDVPVLTEVVTPQSSLDEAAGEQDAATIAPESVEDLVGSMRHEILAKLEPRIESMLSARLGPAFAAAAEHALAEMRGALMQDVRRIVHEAVADSVAHALEAGQNNDPV